MKIRIDSAKKVTLYNPEFDEMRHALDVTLQKTFKSMLASNMTGATIGLKIDISLEKQVVTDNNAQTGQREAMKPEINARVVSAMQRREDKKCKVVGRTSNVELLVDDTGDFFFVTKEEASGQLSMFNSWDEFKEAVEPKTTADENDSDDPLEDDPEAEDVLDAPEDEGESTDAHGGDETEGS